MHDQKVGNRYEDGRAKGDCIVSERVKIDLTEEQENPFTSQRLCIRVLSSLHFLSVSGYNPLH